MYHFNYEENYDKVRNELKEPDAFGNLNRVICLLTYVLALHINKGRPIADLRRM